jgi:peptide/nickel transport system substrate-binding protein
MRKCLCACAVIALTVMAAGCGGSKSSVATSSAQGSSKPYHELRWAADTFPGALDAFKNGFGTPISIESLAVQRLTEFEPDGKTKLGLASSIEQPNSTTYVYHLKSAKFSDGKPMTAADVVFSLGINLHGKESWTKTEWEDVASVSARNSSTVVVKLKRPSAAFPDVVAFSGMVIEKAAAEEAGEKALGSPGHMVIGTGPWKLDSYAPESQVQLSRNPYWTGPPQPAERITINIFKSETSAALALRSGAVAGTGEMYSPKAFTNIPGVHQLKAPSSLVTVADVNTRIPPYNDVHVRRALAYATDASGMINALFPNGEAVEEHSIIPDSMLGTLGSESEVDQAIAALPTYKLNIEKAKQELAKSAYPHGFSTPIEVGAGSESEVATAQILASDLAKIGIKAHVEEQTPAEELAGSTGKTRFDIFTLGSYYPDPESIMGERFGPGQIYPRGGGQNQANYSNFTVDKLLVESAETLNRPKRLQMITKLLSVAGSEVPYWPLYSSAQLGAISDKYVMSGYSYWTHFFTPWALNVKQAS